MLCFRRLAFHNRNVSLLESDSALMTYLARCCWLYGARYKCDIAERFHHPKVYFSGIQPTGVPHLGNYFGFIQSWLRFQDSEPSTSAFYLSIADYHAISTGFLPRKQMRSNILHMTAGLLACGINPERTVLFQQSEVYEHTNLMFMLGALQTVTKLQRLPQYKDKAKRYKSGEAPVNLLIYPVLQAADVLLYKGTHIPVGDDQKQHMNLLTDLAVHFNSIVGVDYFPVPVQVTLFSATSGKTIDEIINDCAAMDTKHFKEALANAIDEHFAPIREKYNNLINDERILKNILENGAQKAREIAAKNVDEIKDIIGLKI
uniref:tryptophan--tRNA ligase n=1 Tax=Parascaris univalens TaxID=6257 RepID=A0A915ALY0_PARUN